MLGSPDGFDKIHILTQVGFLLQCSMDYGRHFPAVEDLKGFCYWPKPKLIDAVPTLLESSSAATSSETEQTMQEPKDLSFSFSGEKKCDKD
ncbi:uncharacterized protein LOC119997112 isoform X2 [Tripterygium wilfordii]|uniref:uncharacterized protein LOC119997112 isoform X2 n=1 Tax=Tripterygium wilfordii TaxID=458696 RepID=UPI0018F847BF|nr:uncharacterized protein LOC119997112 isoform X2 [Tripterygium wilfordii]